VRSKSDIGASAIPLSRSGQYIADITSAKNFGTVEIVLWKSIGDLSPLSLSMTTRFIDLFSWHMSKCVSLCFCRR
jgi:hypothetical protein